MIFLNPAQALEHYIAVQMEHQRHCTDDGNNSYS